MANDTIIYDLEVVDQPEVKQPRTIFAGDQYDGQPYGIFTENDIVLSADKSSVISVNPEFGVQIAGKNVSLSVLPDQLLFGGGYWSLDPRHLSLVASTTPTPIPVLAPATPPLLVAKQDVETQVNYLKGVLV